MLEFPRIAIHEAGHTVMAYLQGKISEGVSIISGNGALGWSRYTPICTRECNDIEELQKCALIAMAGFAAEKVAFTDADLRGATNDLSEAASYSNRMFGTAVSPATKNDEWTKVGQELLRDNWDLVELIAGQLIEYRELTGEQVESLFIAHRDAQTSIVSTEL
jgi:ATP-dependent Zn protease